MNKQKEIEFMRLAIKADEAGRKAAEECKPVPMVVSQHKNMLDDNSPVEKEWYVADGVCGFAWVVIKPGTSSFAKWAKINLPYTYRGYYGGLEISSPLMTQSMARNEAYCSAYARILREAGINAYMHSRID